MHIQRQFGDEPLEFLVLPLQLVVVQHRHHSLATVLSQLGIDRFRTDCILLGQRRHALFCLNLTDNFFLDCFAHTMPHSLPHFHPFYPVWCLILWGADHIGGVILTWIIDGGISGF